MTHLQGDELNSYDGINTDSILEVIVEVSTDSAYVTTIILQCIR